MLPLFFYGTLMDGDVRGLIVGRPLDVVPAQILGYRRVPVAKRSYPTLIACTSTCVDGVLAQAISPEELERLIDYEGDDYVLKPVRVVLAGGEERQAQAFMTSPGILCSSHLEWKLDDWQQRHKRRFLSQRPAPR
ncbi:MAG: gamma-glutamylcyclotransferase [Alphaproteobacteria bacterium]|jgi:hypothetical protein|nr:gamma-glutamylcyclotransferase [Alphaproteobacteria bacterium]